MVFPFTFSFAIPGILNPFRSNPTDSPIPQQENRAQSRVQQTPTNSYQTNLASSSQAEYLLPQPAFLTNLTSPPIPITNTRRISRSQLPKIPRRHSPSLSPTPSTLRALPLSRKRGWEPAFGAEAIQNLTASGKSSSTTSLSFTSTSGYLDTPAKYRDMMDEGAMNDNGYRESQQRQEEDDAPPLKKRRGLAGSIVSTAVSAALIGTAVGLTVYRLWRDRGKDAQVMDVSLTQSDDEDKESIPPPPYDAGTWRPAAQAPTIPVTSTTPRSIPSTPTGTPRTGKGKKLVQVSKRPVGGSVRKTRVKHVQHHYSYPVGVAPSSPQTRPEFDFGREREETRDDGMAVGVEQTEVEDKMDWIGDKLSMLIEQGKRALQSEIVVMSEVKEDEVDDGRGDWEEDQPEEDPFTYGSPSCTPRSRSGSVRSSRAGMRSTRPKNIMVPPSSSYTAPSGVGLGLYNAQSSGSPRRSAYAAPSTSSTTYATASAGFAPSSVPSSSLYTPLRSDGGNGHVRGISYESGLPSASSSNADLNGTFGTEDSTGWESPELVESMKRARARALARRAGAGGV